MPHELETQRLRLRLWRDDDLDNMCAVYMDPEVTRYIATGWADHIDKVRERMERQARRWREHGFGIWAVEDRETGEFLGRSGLQHLDQTDEVEVGYIFLQKGWGKGYATEAARASLRYGFDYLGLDRIVACAYPENTASRNVMTKMGMRYVKTGVWYKTMLVYYEILRGEFTHGPHHFSAFEVPPVG